VRHLTIPSRASPIALVVVGLLAGALSGLLGVGGGILMVPAMVMLLGFTHQRAQATSLAAIAPIAALGAIVFGRTANVDLAAAGLLIGGSLVGVQAGARLMHRMSNERLSLVFGAVLVAVAISLLIPT
jgi:uncharacterized membrane protein YfcA